MNKELEALKRIFKRIDYFNEPKNPYLIEEQKLCGKLASAWLIDDDMRILVGRLEGAKERK